MILIYIGIALIVLAVALFIYNLISPVQYDLTKTASAFTLEKKKEDTQDVNYTEPETSMSDEEDRTTLLKAEKTTVMNDKDQTGKRQ